jgi:riboflavin transporter FmnP
MQPSSTVNKKHTFLVKMVTAAMLSAVASVLMIFAFKVPFMPSFMEMDVSELPALIASFLLGPLWGAAVCLVKNIVNLPFGSTFGIGGICNFILGVSFVVPAGLIYKFRRRFSGAIIGCFVGGITMMVIGLFVNYYIIFPFYANVAMPMEAILNAYRAINPNVNTLWDALIWFNMPFTFVKSLLSSSVTILIYKPLSNALKKFIVNQ